ncbi:flagellar hook-length control protein FliK, partial [Roseomonas nepalensis]
PAPDAPPRGGAPGRAARAGPGLRAGPPPAESGARTAAPHAVPPREALAVEESAGSAKSPGAHGTREAGEVQTGVSLPAAATGSALPAPMVLSSPIPSPVAPLVPAPAAPPEAAPTARLTPRVAPVEQVAPIAIALALGGGAEGRITVSLDPVELGRVEVTVERVGEAARVQVAAERPETLALLARDGASLDRALGGAGIGGDGGRSISFSLLGAEAGGAGSGGFGAGPNGQDGRGGQGGGRQGGPWRGAAEDAPEAFNTQRRALLGLLDIAI